MSVTDARPADEGQSYTGTTGNDKFTGTKGDDYFDMTQGGTDQVKGGAGDDIFSFGATLTAADRVSGGAGYDALSLNGDYAQGLTLAATTLQDVESVSFAAGHSYRVTLNAGNVAAGATLTLDAQPLGTGDSAYLDASAIAGGDLYLRGGKGNDTLIGGGGNDLLRSNGGTDVIDGGGGHNRISFFTSQSGLTLDLGKQGKAQDTGLGILTLSHVEDVSGTLYADHITGDDQDNLFYANGGSDTLTGKGGADWFIVGPDVNGTNPTNVVISGGGDEDLVDFFDNNANTAGVTLDLSSTKLQDTGQGSVKLSGIEDASGTAFDDHVTGTSAANHLFGNTGDDVLDGGAGDDVLAGDQGVGQGDANGFDGPRYTYDAGAGDDTLIGGAGNDTLTGGAGADIFFFAKGSGQDAVTDFVTGADIIRIDVKGVTTFADLVIANDGTGGALVSWKGGASVDLAGISPGSLDQSDFAFGPLAADAPSAHTDATDHHLQHATLMAQHVMVE